MAFELTSPTEHTGRRVNDAYFTPPKLARFLVGLMELRPGAMVLEPSAGGGSFVRPFMGRGCKTYAIDIDGGVDGLTQALAYRVQDFLDPLPTTWPQFDAVGGNPPFNQAKEHVDRSLEVVKPGGLVGFLLRFAFLESIKRFGWWRECPPLSVHLLAERVPFKGDGKSDNCPYAFFQWQKGAGSWPCPLDLVSWKAPA